MGSDDAENDDGNGTSVLSVFLRVFTTVFTMAILSMTAMGMLVARHAPDMAHGTAFAALAYAALPFAVVVQMAGYSAVIAGLSMLLASGRFFPGMRPARRMIVFVSAHILACALFAAVFGWVRRDEPAAWLFFALAVSLFTCAGFGLSFLKLRLESRRYDRLLANFKAGRRRGSQGGAD